jgi:hypothetical protein
MLFKSFIGTLLLTYFDLLLPLIIWQNYDAKEIVKAMASGHQIFRKFWHR